MSSCFTHYPPLIFGRSPDQGISEERQELIEQPGRSLPRPRTVRAPARSIPQPASYVQNRQAWISEAREPSLSTDAISPRHLVCLRAGPIHASRRRVDRTLVRVDRKIPRREDFFEAGTIGNRGSERRLRARRQVTWVRVVVDVNSRMVTLSKSGVRDCDPLTASTAVSMSLRFVAEICSRAAS
jgi:hypothetical protein